MEYSKFLDTKSHDNTMSGFAPKFMPDFLFDHQKALLDWSVNKGKSAIFIDCGMGKTPISLAWSQNVVEKTNGRVLILTPLAVAAQFQDEGIKFDIPVIRSAGEINQKTGIFVTNYEKLDKFNPADFQAVVCDESSILKNYNGARKSEITEFMKKVSYRLLDTATAAPNDYHELGTSSEALGHLGHMDMLNRFFKNDLNNSSTGRMGGEVIKWRLKGHAERPFWRWVCSWARAARKPSDLGFDDDGFDLPSLSESCHPVQVKSLANGMLFDLPAHGLKEQRDERRRSIQERCEKMAELATHNKPALFMVSPQRRGRFTGRTNPGRGSGQRIRFRRFKRRKTDGVSERQVPRPDNQAQNRGMGFEFSALQPCANFPEPQL